MLELDLYDGRSTHRCLSASHSPCYMLYGVFDCSVTLDLKCLLIQNSGNIHNETWTKK